MISEELQTALEYLQSEVDGIANLIARWPACESLRMPVGGEGYVLSINRQKKEFEIDKGGEVQNLGSLSICEKLEYYPFTAGFMKLAKESEGDFTERARSIARRLGIEKAKLGGVE